MPTEEDVRECLRSVYDPDMPANVVDLGLVYDIDIDDTSVGVRMTLTRPGSPESAAIAGEVEEQIQSSFPEIQSVAVEIVWDPPWHPDRMSEDARATLGI